MGMIGTMISQLREAVRGAVERRVVVLPHLDLHSVYGPFEVSVGLMIWAFLTGLILLAGAQYSATSHALRLARQADLKAARENAS